VDRSIRIRAFEPTDAEYAAVARINAAVPEKERHDFQPRTGDDLRSFDEGFARAGHVLGRHVAEVVETGLVVAYAHYFRVPWVNRPACFWCSVRCEPAFARRGVGRRLHAEVMRDLDRLGAAEVWAMARETRPEIVALLAGLGFRELFRSWEFELDLTRPGGDGERRSPTDVEADGERRSPAPAGDVEPPAAQPPSGLVITSLPAEQGRDPAWLAKLHALFVEVNREVPLPGEPVPEPPPAVFADYLQRWPSSLPEACFIARDGDRYAGVCVLHRSEEDRARLNHLFTGVDNAYRGRGVASALKLETIAFGRRNGYARIQTTVESNNPGMLALNEKLGFVRRGGLIVLEKRLSR
jgi:mycothiol synthase